MFFSSTLLLSLIGHFAANTGYGWLFPNDVVQICPGQSFLIPGGFWDLQEYLYVTSSQRKETLTKQVANKTHIFLPFYQFKDGTVFIPEAMPQHEGLYSWSSEKIRIGLPLDRTQLTLKDCSIHDEVYYGHMFTLMVPKEASILEFTSAKSADRWVLWSRINTDNKRGARGEVRKNRWVASDMTHDDAGRYAFLRDSGGEISSTTLTVKERQSYYDVGDRSIEATRFPVLVSEAVLTFIDSSDAKHVLFQNGMVTIETLQIFGSRINLQAEFSELKLSIVDLKSSDIGRYEVRDKNNGLVFIVFVYGISGPSHEDIAVPTVVVGVIATLVFCCCCSRKCQCKKSNASDTSPGSQQPVYVHDPAVASAPDSTPQPWPETSDFPPSVRNAEYQPWVDPNTSSAYSRNNSLPSYDEVVSNDSEPYRPYAPAAPTGASDGVDDFPPIVRNAGRQPWLQPSVSSAQSSDSTLPSYDAVMDNDSESHYPYPPAGSSEASAGGGGADAHPVPSAPPDPGPQHQPRDQPH